MGLAMPTEDDQADDSLFSSFEAYTKACLIRPYGGTKLSEDLKIILDGPDLEISEKHKALLKD